MIFFPTDYNIVIIILPLHYTRHPRLTDTVRPQVGDDDVATARYLTVVKTVHSCPPLPPNAHFHIIQARALLTAIIPIPTDRCDRVRYAKKMDTTCCSPRI